MKHRIRKKIQQLFGGTAYKCTPKTLDEIKNNFTTEEFERCVLCGELTPVPVSTPIQLREFYQEGCGQLCLECHKQLCAGTDQKRILTQEQILLAIEQSRKFIR